jgi:hypothetical protein
VLYDCDYHQNIGALLCDDFELRKFILHQNKKHPKEYERLLDNVRTYLVRSHGQAAASQFALALGATEPTLQLLDHPLVDKHVCVVGLGRAGSKDVFDLEATLLVAKLADKSIKAPPTPPTPTNSPPSGKEKLYLIGGTNRDFKQLTNEVYRIDLDKAVLEKDPRKLLRSRTLATAAGLGSQIFVSGGGDLLRFMRFMTSEMMTKEGFQKRNRLPSTFTALRPIVAVGSKVYSCDGLDVAASSPGADCHIWDASTDTWHKIDSLVEVAGPGSSMAYDGARYIYVVGGYAATKDDKDNGQDKVHNKVQRYDTQENKWKLMAPALYAQIGGSVMLSSGHLLSCGRTFRVRTSKCQEYDPSTNSWKAYPSFGSAIVLTQLIRCNGAVYALGVDVNPRNGSVLLNLERLDEEGQKWSAVDIDKMDAFGYIYSAVACASQPL